MQTGFTRRRFLQLTALATGSAAISFPNLLHARGANGKLNVGFIGLGGQGRSRLTEILGCGVNVIALCDVDENQINEAKKILGDVSLTPSQYVDYRELLEKEKNLDALVIATPDHWHAPITIAAMKADKHIFCEKPLTHTVAETRELRKLSQKKTNLITQMGNQGSASNNMRRGIELIQGGAIGQVLEVHCWVTGVGCHPGLAMPTVGDPIPAGLHWDAWLGVAPYRLYKKDYYHTWNWRGWYDFGNGVMADFGCHNLNLPYRALKLDYAKHIEAEGELLGLPTYSGRNHIRYNFAARGELAPVTVNWYDSGRTPANEVIPKELLAHLGQSPESGVLLLGEKGFTYGGPWNGADYIMLNNERKISGILNHDATKNIAESLPRVKGHLQEWVDACNGGAPTFSNFEIGGHLTEIALSGVVALRTQKALDWNGEKMRAENAPEAEQFIKPHYRKHWTV